MGLYSKHVNVFIICNWKIGKTPNWNVLFFLFALFYFLKFAIIKRQTVFRIPLGVLHCVFCMSIRVGSGLSQSCKHQDDVRKTSHFYHNLTFINPKLTLPLSIFFLASPFSCTSVGNLWNRKSLGMGGRISHFTVSRGTVWFLFGSLQLCICVNILSASEVSLWDILL